MCNERWSPFHNWLLSQNKPRHRMRTVDQNQLHGPAQALQTGINGPPHRQKRRLQDVQLVDFASCGKPNAPGRCRGLYEGLKRFSGRSIKLF